MSPHPLGVSVTLLAALAACGPSNPCGSSEMHLRARFSQPYVGHWGVARGDTLTLPELGDRFKLTDVILDSGRVAVSELGVQVRPGATARFVAGRARREAR